MTAPLAVLRLIALGLLAAAKTIAAVSGVSANEIVLGQTAVFSGPAQALGNGVRTGLETAIQEINTTGGVNGRILKLITRDDGYEPSRAAENARALITQDQVFALIGGVGTPTAAQVVPICDAEGVPFVGPFTGAAALRTPYNPRIINLRPSYGQEIERIVALLVDGRELRVSPASIRTISMDRPDSKPCKQRSKSDGSRSRRLVSIPAIPATFPSRLPLLLPPSPMRS